MTGRRSHRKALLVFMVFSTAFISILSTLWLCSTPKSIYELKGQKRCSLGCSTEDCYYKSCTCQWNRGEYRTKWSHKRVAYYENTTATFNLILLSGDIETNPGWEEDDSEDHYMQDFARSMCKGSNFINFAHINIRSLRNKVEEIKILLNICRFEILAITETYLDKKIDNKQLEIENYKIIRRDRSTGQVGGGCLIYISDNICSSRLKSLETEDIEGIWLKISTRKTSFILGNIYRPPSDLNFFSHFEKVLEKVWMKDNNIMIVGDLNCDFTRAEEGVIHSRYGKKLQDILRQFDLKVLNSEPTRVIGSSSTLIDLIISSRDFKIKETRTLELGISDHMLIQGTIQMRIKRPPPRIVRGR